MILFIKLNGLYVSFNCVQILFKWFTISSFSQSSIDRYDIVYSEDSRIGSNNPFVLGHKFDASILFLYYLDALGYVIF